MAFVLGRLEIMKHKVGVLEYRGFKEQKEAYAAKDDMSLIDPDTSQRRNHVQESVLHAESFDSKEQTHPWCYNLRVQT